MIPLKIFDKMVAAIMYTETRKQNGVGVSLYSFDGQISQQINVDMRESGVRNVKVYNQICGKNVYKNIK